ncbi:MAG: hypothetical protein AB1642_09310 [Pseudomonadota bacterium]
MLGLFGNKQAHPLTDSKEAKQICEDLAALALKDDAACVDEAAGWFESLAGLDGMAPALRFRRAAELAAVSLPAGRRHARDYLVTPRLPRLQEQQLWQRHHGYWSHLVDALTRCLADADADAKALDALRPQLGALLAGLLSARFGCQRWLQLRYRSFDGAQWEETGRIYLRAAQEKLAERPVAPFGPQEGETTVAGEYLRILVFHASAMDSLTPVEIGLAERLVSHFLPRFSLAMELRPECAYWVDAGRPLPPTRLARLPELSPSLRFFGAGPALEALAALRQKIAAQNALPPDLNLGGVYSPAAVLPVLDHLAACWSPQPPTRNHARHRVKSRVGIRGGLADLHALLAGTTLDLTGGDSWQVEDISQGGMSVRLPLARNEWMKIGALLGMQPEGGANWLVGVVRRFARDGEAQGMAGIETLTKTPRATTATDGALQTDLILLDPLRHDSSVRILLAPNSWEAGVPMQLFIDGHPWRLHPDATVEAGEDWLLGRCIVESLDPR